MELETCVTDRHLSRCCGCLMKLFLMLKAHYGSQAKFKLPQIWKGGEIWLNSYILTQSWAHGSIQCQPLAINTTCKSCQNSFPFQAFWRTLWASWRVQMSGIRLLQRSLWGNFGASNQDTFFVPRRGSILGTSNGGGDPGGTLWTAAGIIHLICSGHFSRFSRWSFGVVAQLAEHLHLLTLCRRYGDKGSGRMRGTERKM